MQMKIYLTNLGKYNEGHLVGKWFDLPIYDIEEALKEIGVESGTRYEEFFITDYETDFGLKIGEHESLERLNEIAEHMEDMDIDELYQGIVELYDYDNSWFSMDDFDHIMSGNDPFTIASKVVYGEFNPHHDYFKFDGYANLKSASEYEFEKDKYDTIESYVVEYISDNV